MAIFVVVAVVIAIRAMIVLDPFASATLPVARVVLLSVVMRCNPEGALIRRPAPVAVMPPVARALRVLIPLDPQVIGAWPGRHAVSARGRRFADPNAEVDLRVGRRGGDEEQCRDRERLKKLSHPPTLTGRPCSVCVVLHMTVSGGVCV